MSGTVDQSCSGGSCTFTVSGSHGYGDETSTGGSIVWEDSPNGTGTVGGTINGPVVVADAGLQSSATAISANANAPFSGAVAHFSDGDTAASQRCIDTATCDYTASIDWGDGTTSSGIYAKSPGGGFDVSGSHTWAQHGTYTVKVTIGDDGGAQSVASEPVSIGGTPIVATGEASTVTQTSANLGGTVNPLGRTITDCHFEWGTTTEYGNFAPCATAPGPASSDVPVSAALSNLTPGTTYYYRLDASNASGGSSGSDMTFTTQQPGVAGAPVVVTGLASDIAATGVTLNATVNPSGANVTDCHFEWGTSTAYDKSVPCATAPGGGSSDVAVSAPLTGLDSGTTYHFRIVAANGSATSHGADETFATTATCRSQASFGVVNASGKCLLATTTNGSTTYVSTGPVDVNGINITPASGARILLDPQADTIKSDSGPASLSVGLVTLWQGVLDWTGLDGGTSGRATLADDPANPSASLGGFGLVGTFEPTLVKGGSALIGAYLQLPDLLGDEAAAVTLKTDSTHGLSLDGLRIHLTTAKIGALPLKNLDVSYSASDGSWGGGATITIGDTDIQADVGFVHGHFDHADAQASGLNVPIGPPPSPLFLDSISAGVHTNPFAFSGGIGIIAGPKFATNPINGNDISLAEVDGTFSISFANPPDIALDGVLKLLSFKVASAHVDYNFGGTLSLGLQARLPWWDDGQTPPVIRIDGGLSAWLNLPKLMFNAEGRVEVCLAGCVSADVLASNVGAAACVNVFGAQVGGAYTWADAKLHFPIGCDLSAYRATASAAAVGGSRTVTIPAGLKVAGMRIGGSGAAPIVTITGPGGERITTPTSGQGIRTASYWLVRNPADDTTGVVLAHPTAGVWRITAAPRSPRITLVNVSYSLPAPSVRASVTGHGQRRRLAYDIKAIPGQTVEFAERLGRTTSVIGFVRATHGTLQFTPARGAAGRRPIIAVVLEHGLVRTQLVVGSYVAPTATGPGRPGHVRVRRRANELIVSWAATRSAASYVVLAKLPRHRTQLFSVSRKRHRLVIANVLPGDGATLTITALDSVGASGRPAVVVVRPGR